MCRGLHVVNALLGGTLVIDMDVNHRHHVHQVAIDDPDDHLGVGNRPITCSCYHHQEVERIADGITVLGRAEDGVVEAVSIASNGWAAGVQWHPEDTYDVDPDQLLPVPEAGGGGRSLGVESSTASTIRRRSSAESSLEPCGRNRVAWVSSALIRGNRRLMS